VEEGLLVKVFLYPEYVKASAIRGFFRGLHGLLEANNIELKPHWWDGDPGSIPDGEPVMFRVSSVMECSLGDVVRPCSVHGHFVFYDEKIFDKNGREIDREDHEAALDAFLDRLRTYRETR